MKPLVAVLATVLAAILAVALSFKTVHGAGINLAWDDCGAHGAELRTFSCNTNQGSHTLVVSFVAPAGVKAMSANEITMDLESADSSLPDWWKMRTGLCRPGSLTWSVDFTGGPFHCQDYWQGFASAGLSMDVPTGNRTRIKGVVALPAGSPSIGPVPEGTEVYSFKVIINNAKTTGSGACGGCSSPACIVLQSIKLNQPQPLVTIFLANPDTRNWASWQCPSFPLTDYPGLCVFTNCPTPARSHTWGRIKQLYR